MATPRSAPEPSSGGLMSTQPQQLERSGQNMPAGMNPADYGLIGIDPLSFGGDVDALVAHATRLQSHAGDLARTIDSLHTALAEQSDLRQQAEQQAQAHAEARQALESQHSVAVAAYRQAMLNGDPTLPPELVQGTTIDDIDSSLEKARGVVNYIREKIASPGGEGPAGQIARAPTEPPRVPAGAPGRTLPDVSNMTPREKLVFGTSMAAAGR
jgi:hypothetical protein